jgi:hypothetical protein
LREQTQINFFITKPRLSYGCYIAVTKGKRRAASYRVEIIMGVIAANLYQGEWNVLCETFRLGAGYRRCFGNCCCRA